MRFAKSFLILGAVLILGSSAKADEIRVTATHIVFQPQNAAPDQKLVFSSTFLFDLDTSQLVPGTMSTHVADTLEGTPFTDWVPKPNFHGPIFTYFDPNIDGISLVFGEQFPAIGSYSVSKSALFCVTDDCVQHFGGSRDVLFGQSGELSISAVPEPEPGAGLLLACCVLVVALFIAKAKFFHQVS
jgi:hypothetical protein